MISLTKPSSISSWTPITSWGTSPNDRLAFYNDDGLIIETFVLTPDTPENCKAQQEWATGQPPLEMVSMFLMNSCYLMYFDVPTLQKMLQKLEGVKKRSLIEDVNYQLITTMIARRLAEASDMSEGVG